MRLLFLVLFVLLGLIQYPLWLGKGGWFKVWDLQRQVAEQRETNEGLRARNAALEAEVRDLEGGSGAIEERARGELGMMREGEVFVHILPQNTPAPAGGASLAADPAARPAAPAHAGAPAARTSAAPPRPANPANARH
ncbi:cell division protein FtsB [Achromobacter denitrificans]